MATGNDSLTSVVRGVLGAAALCAATVGPVAQAEPLLTRNQNPLVAPFGLPSPLPARLPSAGRARVTLDANWSNAAYDDSSASYDFTLDGESRDVRLRVEYALNSDWAVYGELPWRSLSGGTLDSFIDDWHKAFGLPRGSRNHMPQDRLLIRYVEGSQTLLDVHDSSSGIADVPVGVGYQVHATEQRALAAWMTVKLPTGDSDGLQGSGATDVALSLSGQAQLAEHWQVFGQVDAAWLGKGDILRERQQDFAWAGLAGVSWNAWRRLDLTAQVYANSRVFDGSIKGLAGDAVVLTYGGTWRTEGGWRVDFGMNEDIEVDASPDATFYFAVQRGF